MTTAELIKKREEEQNKPSQEKKPSVNVPPVNGMNDAESKTTVTNSQTIDYKPNQVSLYEIGKQSASKSIEEAEKMRNGTPSPIITPEYEKFRNEVIGAQQFGVETPEQAAARERRDFIKQGLTGFTEGLSALANLYYTTKGAPNQKLTSQMPALQQRLYQERLERDKKLENFRAWQRAKADKEEERAYNLNFFNLKQEAADKAAEKKAKIDAQAAQIKYMRDLGLIDAKKEAELEKLKGKADFDKALEETKQQNRVALAGINNQAAMDRVSARGGGAANSTIRVPIGGDGQYAEYRKNDLTNPIVISQIYNSLPDDYRVKGKEKVWNQETKSMEYPYDENPSTQKMQEAIGKALSDGYLTEMVPEIQVGGKKNNGKRNEGDNTPPSRREKENKDNDNVPPSRRK